MSGDHPRDKIMTRRPKRRSSILARPKRRSSISAYISDQDNAVDSRLIAISEFQGVEGLNLEDVVAEATNDLCRTYSNANFFGDNTSTPSEPEDVGRGGRDTIIGALEELGIPIEFEGASSRGHTDSTREDSLIKDIGCNRNFVSGDAQDTLVKSSSKERSATQLAALFVLVWIMPFLYTISTRLPFICLALEVFKRNGIKGKNWQVGVLLGSYQACRALANFVISKLGGSDPMRRLHVPMAFLAIFGWVMANDDLIESSSSVWHLFYLCAVGLSEVVVNLQTAVIHETSAEAPGGILDKDVLEVRMRSQYCAVAAGATVAFVVGGYLFSLYGFGAICWFGMITSILHLLLTLFYLHFSLYYNDGYSADQCSPKKKLYKIIAISFIINEAGDIETGEESMFPTDEIASLFVSAKEDEELQDSLQELYKTIFDGSDTSDGVTKLRKIILQLMDINGDGVISKKEFLTYLSPRVYHKVYGDSHCEMVKVVWPYINIVAATQAIVALCIGTFLSTSLLMYTEIFDLDASIVGVLLGVGEGFAAASIFMTLHLKNRSSDKEEDCKDQRGGVCAAILSRPLNVPALIFVIASATMGFAIPSLTVAIMCQMIMSTFNDVSVSLLNELIATSTPPRKFKNYQGRGQWLRRLGNVVTGVFGPILFEIKPQLPFIFFGGIVFVWCFFLWGALHLQAKKIQSDDDKDMGNILRAPFAPFLATSTTPWHMLEQEYFISHRDEVMEEFEPSNAHTLDIAEMKVSIRRLKALSQSEKEMLREEVLARKKLESKFKLLEAKAHQKIN